MTILKSFSYQIAYKLLILIIPFVTMPYIARVIGVEGVGIYSFTHAVANYFVIFAMLGLQNYGNRSIAKVRDDKDLLSKTFWEIYFLQIVTSLIAVTAYLSYILLTDSLYIKVFFIQMLFVFSAVFDITWLFFGLEEFKLTVIRNSAVKILSLVFIFSFVKNAGDLMIYTLILAASMLVSQLSIWPYLKSRINWVKPSFRGIASHIKPNLALFIPVVSISLYKIMDKVMIGAISSVIQLGYYENAEKINAIQISLVTVLGTVMLPRMSNLLAGNNKEKYVYLIRNSMRFTMFLAIASSFGLYALSHDFILLYLGSEFMTTSTILKLLVPTGIFIAWANVIRTHYIIPAQRDKVYIVSVILGAVVNIAFNLALIPRYGAVGAAVATILAELIVMVYQTLLVRKELDVIQYIKDNAIFIPIGMIMVIGIKTIKFLVGGSVGGLIIQILVGMAIYIGLSILNFYIFDKEMLVYLDRFIKRSNA